jgi:hypothetical protein
LQRYTITSFNGEYRDWLRFWNQFSVEIDQSSIAQVSKFNYLIELVKEKPREDIMGLPHTPEGYAAAKQILQNLYGKDTKVHRAVVNEIETLEPIPNNNYRISNAHTFYNKLSRTVRTLSTMGKLGSAQSFVYTLFDKLGPVREALVQKDDCWEQWGLEELVENLGRYVERNPLSQSEGKRDDRDNHQDKVLMEKGSSRPACVYCDGEHSSNQCTKILDVATRREIHKRRRACFNCTAPNHQVSKCRSRGCFNCGEKHHTSICQNQISSLGGDIKEKGFSGKSGATSTHPSVLAHVGEESVRVVMDTMASNTYICTDLITRLDLKPVRKERKQIEQMFGVVDRLVDIYEVEIQSAVTDFKMKVEAINAEKDVLTTIRNPRISQVKINQPRLRRLHFTEENSNDNVLPVHIMLGVGDYNRIRTNEPSVLGLNPASDPVAEYTELGWTLLGGAQVVNF